METRDFNAFEQSLECALFAILDCETTGFSPARGDRSRSYRAVSVGKTGIPVI